MDRAILRALAEDGRLSAGELGRRLGLSQPAAWRRVRRLEEAGVLTGVRAEVDREKLGFKMQIFAQVKMTTLSDEDRAKFHKAINDIPEILECYTVFGEMDAMLKILAPDVIWYQDFIFSTLLKLPGVIDVRSIVTLTESKSTTAIPMRARKFR